MNDYQKIIETLRISYNPEKAKQRNQTEKESWKVTERQHFLSLLQQENIAGSVLRSAHAAGLRCRALALLSRACRVPLAVVAAGLSAASVQKAAENILLKRMGTTQEVADAVVYLASDASSYVTAQTLNVNGGLYF